MQSRKNSSKNTFYAVIILQISIEIQAALIELIHFILTWNTFCGNSGIFIHLNSLKFWWELVDDSL